MGEAKLRGSFEERKAMATERERLARLERAKCDALHPRGKSHISVLIASAFALGANSFFQKK